MPVEIQVNVTDDYGVDSVLAEISYPDDTKQNFTMNNTSGDLYYLNFTDTLQTGVYSVRVLANDSYGNLNDSVVGNFSVSVEQGYGNASVEVVSPGDNSSYFVGSVFNVSVNVSAVGGNLSECNLSLSFGGDVFNVGSENPLAIGNLSSGSSVLKVFNVSVVEEGADNLTATASCSKGGSGSDVVYNLSSKVLEGPSNFNAYLSADKNDVMLNWSGVAGVEGYKIWYSSNASWILGLTEATGVEANVTLTGSGNTSWTDSNVNLSSERYYAVASFNGSVLGFAENRTGKFAVEVYDTKAMISLPFSTTQNFDEVFPDANVWALVYKYNGTDWLYNYYDGTGWNTDAGFDDLDDGVGYYCTDFGSNNVSSVGVLLRGNVTYTVRAGHDLFGWESRFRKNFTDVFTDGDAFALVYQYNGSDWLYNYYDGSQWITSSGFDTLGAGEGYYSSDFVNPLNITYERNEI